MTSKAKPVVPSAEKPATGERGEDFQSFLKRKAEENIKSAKDTKLMAPIGVAWYTIIPESASTTSTAVSNVSVQVVEKLRKEGASVMEGEVAQFKREQTLSKGDADWFKTVLKSGTVTDRCSALTLAIQASPLHCLEYIKALGEMTKSKSRHEALLALDAMRDLFTSTEGNRILPPNRKLRYVHQQPGIEKLDSAELRRKCSLIWFWEESLKAAYLEMIRVLEIIAQDPISHSRQRACRILFELLRANPCEQNINVMSLLANKLGDSERILASRIPYYFTELVNAHPKILTAGAIDHMRSVIDRSGVADRNRYYALCFLVQIRLTRSTPAITASLLQIYLGLFTKYILNNMEAVKGKSKKDAKRRLQKRIRHKQKKRGEAVEAVDVPEEHARLAKALLTGINRAFPFASGAGSELKTLLLSFADPLLKMCGPLVAFPTTVQALNLLLTLAPFDESLKGQVLKAFQMVLDEQDRLRQASASHGLFIRAFTRACGFLMEVNDRKSLQTLMKSLLRFCLAIVSPGFVVAALGVLGSVLQRFPAMKSMINSAPESLEAARSEGLYELIALSRHYQPRVRRYALAILETSRLPLEGASDCQVTAEPFEKLSFLMLLDVWNRMRRVVEVDKKNSKKTIDSDEDDDDESSSKMDYKKTDNSEVAAGLYEMDEYQFISKFVAEKDEISLKEQAAREKLLSKRKPIEEDADVVSDDAEEVDSEADDAELEAEADEIMQQAIRKHASSAFGNEEEDDDFAYEAESDDENEDSDEIEDIDYEDLSDNSSDDDENEDYDALFVDSDADNIALLSEEEEDEISDVEFEAPTFKKSKQSSGTVTRNKKKKKMDVFAAASDYEDALMD